MMHVLAIAASAAILYLVGRPIIKWFENAKKEMVEQDDAN